MGARSKAHYCLPVLPPCAQTFTASQGLMEIPEDKSKRTAVIRRRRWCFHSSRGNTYQFTFDYFDTVGDPPKCKHMYLKVLEKNEGQMRSHPRLCGKVIPEPVHTRSSSVSLLFLSDRALDKNGLHVRWKVFGCNEDRSEPSGQLRFPRDGVFIAYPATCVWTLIASQDQTVELSVRKLNLERCDVEYLRVFEGQEEGRALLDNLCQLNSSVVITSTRRVMSLHLRMHSLREEAVEASYQLKAVPPADLRAKGVIASGVIDGRTSSRRYPSSQEFGARALGRRTSTGLSDHTAVHSEGRPDSLFGAISLVRPKRETRGGVRESRWGDALRMSSNEAVQSSSMSNDQFFRNTEHHSLGTLMLSGAARRCCSAMLLGLRCTSSTRRGPTSVETNTVPMVTLKVGETSGKGNVGHRSRRRTSGPAAGDVRDQARIRKPGSAGRLGEVRRLKKDSGHLASAGSQPSLSAAPGRRRVRKLPPASAMTHIRQVPPSRSACPPPSHVEGDGREKGGTSIFLNDGKKSPRSTPQTSLRPLQTHRVPNKTLLVKRADGHKCARSARRPESQRGNCERSHRRSDELTPLPVVAGVRGQGSRQTDVHRFGLTSPVAKTETLKHQRKKKCEYGPLADGASQRRRVQAPRERPTSRALKPRRRRDPGIKPPRLVGPPPPVRREIGSLESRSIRAARPFLWTGLPNRTESATETPAARRLVMMMKRKKQARPIPVKTAA
ncbi:hypothetical protein HPB47_017746 [Ixodes persulcatus]|uniref:Uncharacterized protein n=1 Tax=Ixodes persulcatus TaxID=34615 RepID=A0AC60QMI8_IXOPE|nr:hypothetical protein HPB47_017746 [Ixodes persulcatus]